MNDMIVTTFIKWNDDFWVKLKKFVIKSCRIKRQKNNVQIIQPDWYKDHNELSNWYQSTPLVLQTKLIQKTIINKGNNCR